MNQIDRVLAETFFFDAVDVAANRTGRLSPDQEQGFRHNSTRADRLQHVAEQPDVKVAESLPSEYRNTTNDTRFLVVGNVHFPMFWDDIAKFRADTVYRVYYAQVGSTPHMLSIEVVR